MRVEEVLKALEPYTEKIVEAYSRMLDELEQEFAVSENPLCAWHAFYYARAAGLEIPGWVLQYFQVSAEKLVRLRDVGEGSGLVVAKALGFGGRGQGNTFSRFRRVQERLWAVQRVRELLDAESQSTGPKSDASAADTTMERIFDQVAEEVAKSPFNVEWPFVQRREYGDEEGGSIGADLIRRWWSEKSSFSRPTKPVEHR